MLPINVPAALMSIWNSPTVMARASTRSPKYAYSTPCCNVLRNDCATANRFETTVRLSSITQSSLM